MQRAAPRSLGGLGRTLWASSTSENGALRTLFPATAQLLPRMHACNCTHVHAHTCARTHARMHSQHTHAANTPEGVGLSAEGGTPNRPSPLGVGSKLLAFVKAAGGEAGELAPEAAPKRELPCQERGLTPVGRGGGGHEARLCLYSCVVRSWCGRLQGCGGRAMQAGGGGGGAGQQEGRVRGVGGRADASCHTGLHTANLRALAPAAPSRPSAPGPPQNTDN